MTEKEKTAFSNYQRAREDLDNLAHKAFQDEDEDALSGLFHRYDEPELYYVELKGEAVYAVLKKVENLYILLAGARMRKVGQIKSGNSYTIKSYERIKKAHKEYLTKGYIRDCGKYYISIVDIKIDNPSLAAMVVFGNARNGWREWKRIEDDKFMDEVARQKADVS